MRLIDADALLDEVMDRYCEKCDKRKGIKNGKFRIIYEIGDAPCRACEIDDMKMELEDAPTIDTVKHGKWLIMPKRAFCEFNSVTAVRYMCSECANDSSFMYPYCHSCGARMDDINE